MCFVEIGDYKNVIFTNYLNTLFHICYLNPGKELGACL